ncbi:hypothetical protein JX265_007565 [Neoarthrinium moseri]|uniref:SRR1-like domain-containing protein n=1 Tax=Neoarthrinium moseri TaxID=1658444 RepID=A0A9P9WJV5_9PEZI|nr:hypothetical protein JX265_007565 [Neoarthrinium moseri]
MSSYQILPGAEDSVWETSTRCAELKQKLMEAPVPRETNKIVCFGPVSLTYDLHCLDNDNPNNQRFSSTTQHAAAVAMAEVLKLKTGNMVKLLAEDPWYDSASKHVLRQEGFQVIEGHGGRGFLEVDEHSLVFTVRCNVPVKQVVGELVQPAALVWAPVNLTDITNGKWNKEIMNGKTTVIV